MAQPVLARTVTAVLFNVFCLAYLMASLAVFRSQFGRSISFWQTQAPNSCAIYHLHPLILSPLALAFVPWSISIYAKALAITRLAYLASWGISAAVLTRLRGLRRMF